MTASIDRQNLQDFYGAFNQHDVEAVLNSLQPDVQWANGTEGGFVHGIDNVREYWRQQFEQTHTELEILSVDFDERDRAVLKVHQILRDRDGNLIIEQQVGHRFTFSNGLVAVFEIVDPEPKPTTHAAE
ncbi:nuclear transport factor 2 family protein [bacterium]|nr:MAG: nuclear transport factor 2 family protein [bacterium]